MCLKSLFGQALDVGISPSAYALTHSDVTRTAYAPGLGSLPEFRERACPGDRRREAAAAERTRVGPSAVGDRVGSKARGIAGDATAVQ